MAPERAKPSPFSSSAAPPPPPRTINVQKFAESRAPELESLHAIVAGRLAGDFRIPRGKRRRTTGHESRRKKRRRLGGEAGGGKQEGSGGERDPKKMSRRVRRRMEFQKNPGSGFCTSGDGTRRLRTHLWHAKRFAMVKRWGFYLPLGLQGRGRGSRAVLRWLKSEALVHDASYSLPIQLEGPEDSILAILRMVFLPSPSELSEESANMVANGLCCGNALLCHAGMPLSQLIAPVLYMWRPVSSDNGKINTDHDDVLNGQISAKQDHASNGQNITEQHMVPDCPNSAEQEHVPDCCGSSGSSECCTSCRQLLIWIHAAAFKEGFDLLRSVCQKQMHGSGVSVSCSSREGQIARLEVMGAKALKILQKILHPVLESCIIPDNSISRRPCLTACTNSWPQKAFIFNHAEHLPSHAILSLTVHDPRESPSRKNEPVPAPSSSGIQGDLQDKNTSDSNDLISVLSTKEKHTLLSLWMKPEANSIFLSDCKNLWDSNCKQNPPLPENILCTEKHHSRLKLFYLSPTDDGFPSAEAKVDFSRSCSVLLLKHANPGNNFVRWSIILPLSWVKPFWISLVTHGARAIGLRERRWIASNNGFSSFPSDFPDCEAYTSFMADESAVFKKAAELRPRAVRPFRVPLPPPWDCITSTIRKRSNILRDSQTPDVQCSSGVARATSSVSSENENSQPSSSSDHCGASFPGFVARTSKVLTKHLAKISERQLLLFPNMRMLEKGFFELIENNRHNWVTGIANLVHTDKDLCFVRVLLRAYKEGVFEDGAIVCAPVGTDLSQWTSRSDEEEHSKLQVPLSSIVSCFAQQDSGERVLQVPEGSADHQTFRWPIGFVTSGFVRGSTKPVAVAFCEATLLAMLRGQQWNQMPTRGPDIYVLVRNLKSSAYRRALATVVLEQQKDDLVVM